MASFFCNVNLGFRPKTIDGFCFQKNYTSRNFLHALRSCPFLKEQSSCRRKRRLHCRDSYQSNNDVAGADEISKRTLIWRAIKLPIYSVALVPLTVASACAYVQSSQFPISRYLVLLGSSILIITWLNLSNDVYDFDTGADKNKKESVVNLAGSRTGTLAAAYACLGLGFAGLEWATMGAANFRAILLLACAVFCGYIYQCPPFRLSYIGLGEPFCFAAFGPFATTAFYMLMDTSSSVNSLPLTTTVLCSSVLVGFTTSLILFCSHFHQVEEDIAVGKFSPLVRLGTEKGSMVVKVAITMLYIILVGFGLSWTLPLTSTVSGPFFPSLRIPITRGVSNSILNTWPLICFISSVTLPADVTHGTPCSQFCRREPQCERLRNMSTRFDDVTSSELVLGVILGDDLRFSCVLVQDKKLIFMAKYYCVRLHALFGAALAIGLVMAKKMRLMGTSPMVIL